MSLARNQRRLDRRAARMPVSPTQDPEGKALHEQLLHLIRSSPCPDNLKMAAQIQVLAASTVLLTFPGEEAAKAAFVADRFKDAVEMVAKQREEHAL